MWTGFDWIGLDWMLEQSTHSQSYLGGEKTWTQRVDKGKMGWSAWRQVADLAAVLETTSKLGPEAAHLVPASVPSPPTLEPWVGMWCLVVSRHTLKRPDLTIGA